MTESLVEIASNHITYMIAIGKDFKERKVTSMTMMQTTSTPIVEERRIDVAIATIKSVTGCHRRAGTITVKEERGAPSIVVLDHMRDIMGIIKIKSTKANMAGTIHILARIQNLPNRPNLHLLPRSRRALKGDICRRNTTISPRQIVIIARRHRSPNTTTTSTKARAYTIIIIRDQASDTTDIIKMKNITHMIQRGRVLATTGRRRNNLIIACQPNPEVQ